MSEKGGGVSVPYFVSSIHRSSSSVLFFAPRPAHITIVVAAAAAATVGEVACGFPMSSHPFSECSPLQSAFYRRRDLYSLAWSHSSQDLSGYLVVSAANGGFIAITRDPRRMVMLGKATALKPRILVYTAAGQLVESIPVSACRDRETKNDYHRCSDANAISRVVG